MASASTVEPIIPKNYVVTGAAYWPETTLLDLRLSDGTVTSQTNTETQSYAEDENEYWWTQREYSNRMGKRTTLNDQQSFKITDGHRERPLQYRNYGKNDKYGFRDRRT